MNHAIMAAIPYVNWLTTKIFVESRAGQELTIELHLSQFYYKLIN